VRRPILLGALGLVTLTVVAVGVAATDIVSAGPLVIQSGQSHSSFMYGPTTFSASFGSPTQAGDLLVADVICGVFIGGQTNATLSLPAGWVRGVGLVGGIQGGLETAEYYYPDNPGGITSFNIGSIPGGSEADCTTFSSELAVMGSAVTVQTSGTASATSGSSISATTAAAVPAGDLVLLSSTDGTAVPDNAYTLPAGFAVLGQENDDANDQDQPGTFSDLTATGSTVEGGRISWSGGATDSVAVVMALNIPATGPDTTVSQSTTTSGPPATTTPTSTTTTSTSTTTTASTTTTSTSTITTTTPATTTTRPRTTTTIDRGRRHHRASGAF